MCVERLAVGHAEQLLEISQIHYCTLQMENVCTRPADFTSSERYNLMKPLAYRVRTILSRFFPNREFAIRETGGTVTIQFDDLSTDERHVKVDSARTVDAVSWTKTNRQPDARTL